MLLLSYELRINMVGGLPTDAEAERLIPELEARIRAFVKDLNLEPRIFASADEV